MKCPYCQKEDTKVVDKRDFGEITKRRRECLSCEKRFNTLENVESARLRIVKKDGRREEFDRDKIKKGIERACEKRPISNEQIEKMVMAIEDKLRKKGKEVDSSYVGEVVSKELKKADGVAYIRFASVYRDFKELSDFKKEIKQLTK
ncbi:MAG: transcriptional regulator NrdR [Nanoarchaeota archaeon]|nr:transcriptional regulator NrdR [Nanoarchaeota archaeon]